MPDFSFEREVRTPYSEAYTISEDDRPVGRVDIHFAGDVVHVAIAVDESLTQEAIQEIIDTIDEDMVDAVGIGREGFVVAALPLQRVTQAKPCVSAFRRDVGQRPEIALRFNRLRQPIRQQARILKKFGMSGMRPQSRHDLFERRLRAFNLDQRIGVHEA